MNSKPINAIFCGVSLDEFHKISHMKTARKLGRSLKQPMRVPRKSRTRSFKMLTTKFEELIMGDDETFDSFYGKLNEIVLPNSISERRLKILRW